MKADFYINNFGRVCGSVSSGTHRHEDLVKAFSDELAAIKTLTPALVHEARSWLATDLDWQTTVWDSQPEVQDLCDEELGSHWIIRGYWLVQELQESLSNLAPEGFYFGSHYGDGADFGWWREDSETDQMDSYLGQSEEKIAKFAFAYGDAGPMLKSVIGNSEDNGMFIELDDGHFQLSVVGLKVFGKEVVVRHENWNDFLALVAEYGTRHEA